MQSDWAQVTLGQLATQGRAEIKTGPFGTKLKADEYTSEGAPLISVREIQLGRVEVGPHTPCVPPAVQARMPEYLLQLGDIVFARKGGIERSALIPKEQVGFFMGSDALRVRLDDTTCSRFVSYVVRSRQTQAWLIQHSTGSTMASLSGRVLALLPLKLPPLPEQRRIAAVLGALDDKIELNRKMNQTLEEMAQAIFKSWFIDFDGHDPADLVDSELGPIPRGWEVGSFGDVAELHRETVDPTGLDPHAPYIGLANMPERSISLTAWGCAAEATSTKAVYEKGDLLFGKLRPYFKKVGVAPNRGICSSDILVIRPVEEAWRSYVLGVLTYDPFIDFATAVSTGTRMPRVSWKSIQGYAVVLPDLEVRSRYHKFIQPLVERILAGNSESRTLAELRDSLLPKLISGELRVPEAEEQVEAAL